LNRLDAHASTAAASGPHAPAAVEVEVDEQVRERLRALGYVR
jgi:hypothetical protein